MTSYDLIDLLQYYQHHPYLTNLNIIPVHTRYYISDVFIEVYSKMAADLCHFFKNAVTLEIMVGIAPYLVHRGTLGAPSTFLVLALV